MNEPIQILIVDDDAAIREMLREYLSGHGYRVLEADSAGALRALLDQEVPHVLLLDVHLPGEDGLSLARYVREHFDIGIIMVSGAGETVDRIIGLEVGADDYLAKPFDPREMLARIKSVLRRYRRQAPVEPAATEHALCRSIALGRCSLDLDSQLLTGPGGADIPITNMEFELLKVFVGRPNRPLSRDQILALTQNREWDPFDRSIDIRIARLRRKLEPDAGKPQLIKTVRGVGYMLVPNPR
jgi:DNA-binding response OmpR family regulator